MLDTGTRARDVPLATCVARVHMHGGAIDAAGPGGSHSPMGHYSLFLGRTYYQRVASLVKHSYY